MTGDAIAITFKPESGPRRRFRYEPRPDGPGWWRIEDEWNGCRWRIVGREPVDDVECDADAEVLVA
ncbi:hypothetical protein GWK26_08690 [haloarchaeon 3A1-DGR]|nr:hypothetical protein GWK26_08690 [haloarchaeon 3A1-DGR]